MQIGGGGEENNLGGGFRGLGVIRMPWDVGVKKVGGGGRGTRGSEQIQRWGPGGPLTPFQTLLIFKLP